MLQMCKGTPKHKVVGKGQVGAGKGGKAGTEAQGNNNARQGRQCRVESAAENVGPRQAGNPNGTTGMYHVPVHATMVLFRRRERYVKNERRVQRVKVNAAVKETKAGLTASCGNNATKQRNQRSRQQR